MLPSKKLFNLTFAVIATAGVTFISGVGVGPLPPLGNLLNPGTGVWTMARDAQLPTTRNMHIPGLQHPVIVSFASNGGAYIKAQSNHDLFFTIGYLQAKFRLFQMDLMRRQGEGLLSQVVGKEALPSDEFEDSLGISRTAATEWLDTPVNSPAYHALSAFSQGVNARITQDERTGTLPYMFKLLNYKPTLWTPIDSLVIQGDMTQTLDLSTTPIAYALLVHSLGYQRTMDFFPVLPIDKQHPYDLGPYPKAPLTKIVQSPFVTKSEYLAATALGHEIEQVPPQLLHQFSDSNNWAVSGSRTASGKPLMAGDPHLNQTIPSIWYQITASSPSYHFSGVSIPGIPIILIGHNQDISWSLTDVQNQSTYFYEERTSAKHPGQYYFRGKWINMETINYTIPVKGKASVHWPVELTVQGPILTDHGATLAMDWMGNIPSPDMQSLLGVVKSTNYAQFKSALSLWHSPTQNFVYADRYGNIGMISAGYYPIVNASKPWLPMPGTGQDDIVGSIPYASIPQVYDPKSGFVFSANQREVGPNYPYYIGTSADFFSNGYRADEIYRVLSRGHHLTVKDMENLQNNVRDDLAGRMVPKLLQALQTTSLTGNEAVADSTLSHWNDEMNVNSVGATLWWTFWTSYLQDTFGPWWKADHVPVNVDPNLAIGPSQTSLDEDLEAWTQNDPNNRAFTVPGGAPRSAPQVMRLAFSQTVQKLSKELGPRVSTWTWGRIHARHFPALSQIPQLGYGPRPSGGDEWTVDAADGGAISTAGPSWRFVMNWANGNGYGVYPGGQSENPLSPWYEDQISAWWNGQYYPIWSQQHISHEASTVVWNINP